VIIPQRYQDQVLNELHQEHQGIAEMKAVARSHVWWPKLDECIEQLAENCLPCQQVKNIPSPAPLNPWVWASRPWQRICIIRINFAGPMKGKTYLRLVDAHSKWPEVVEMSSTSAASTIQQLPSLFARFGLPEHCVLDNGPPFNSQDFAAFMKSNGIKHICSSPYQPATNGWFVQTFKRALVTSEGSGRPVHHHLASFLLTYRNTPHATTNHSPSELFLTEHCAPG